MPFAEREYIDSKRAMRILGVGYETIRRLAASGLIDWVDYRKGSWKRVRYQSLLEFCDRLREQHKIVSRRPQLSAPGLRHRDEDLMPFPLSDTIGAEEARGALGYCRNNAMIRIIQEGHFDAYQIVPFADWRISRSSLLAYLERVKNRHRAVDGGYKVPTISPHF